MNDEEKTKLIEELQRLRQRVAELEASEAERRQAEEALRESEENFRALADNANDGIMIAAGEKGAHVYANRRMAEITGYSVPELLKTTMADLVHPDQLQEVMERYQKRLEGKPAPRQYEIVFVRKDGKSVPLEMTSAKTVWRGQPATIVVFRDITERKQAEEALARERNLLRTLIDNLPDLIYVKDTESRFVIANIAAARLMGATTPDELLGKTDSDFYPQELAKQYYTDEQEIIRSGQPLINREEPLMDLVTGRRGWLSTTKVPLRDSLGQITGFVGIGKDITERKQTEEILKRRAMQLQTAAEVSRAASSILNPDELIQQVVNLVRERFDLYYAGLFLVDRTGEWTGEPGRWAVLQAGTGEAGRKMLEQGHKLEVGGTSMIGWCVANRQARIALDVGEEAVRFDNPLLPETRSELALPLISRGQAIGAMTIQSAQPAAFSPEDITVLQTMADQLANAIENARLFEDQTKRAARLTLVNEVMRKAASTLDLETLLRDTVETVQQSFQYYHVAVFLADEGTGELALRAAASGFGAVIPEEYRQAVGIGMIGWAAKTGQTQLANDTSQDPHYVAVGEWAPLSELSVPLKLRDKVIGVLDVESERRNAFTLEDVATMETLADQLAMAIESARLFEETRRTSFLLGERVRELACLNDLGRKIEETPPVPEFLRWVAARVPLAMRYREVCLAAVEFEGQVYGSPVAMNLPCQMVQVLRVGGQVVGRIYIAYTEEHEFLDEESALLGDVVRRVSGYIESRRLFEQIQARAERERLIREISDQMQRATDMESLLRITAEGLNRALGGSRAYVRLGTDQGSSASGGNGLMGERDD